MRLPLNLLGEPVSVRVNDLPAPAEKDSGLPITQPSKEQSLLKEKTFRNKTIFKMTSFDQGRLAATSIHPWQLAAVEMAAPDDPALRAAPESPGEGPCYRTTFQNNTAARRRAHAFHHLK